MLTEVRTHFDTVINQIHKYMFVHALVMIHILQTLRQHMIFFYSYLPHQIPVVLYHGTQDERLQLRRTMFRGASSSKKRKSQSGSDAVLPVVVTSYEICMRDQQYLQNRSWKFLVVDEGHRIKNLNCKLIR